MGFIRKMATWTAVGVGAYYAYQNWVKPMMMERREMRGAART